MPPMPVYQGTRVRQDGTVVPGQQRADTPEVGKVAKPRQGRCVIRYLQMAKVEREVCDLFAKSEKTGVGATGHKGLGAVGR